MERGFLLHGSAVISLFTENMFCTSAFLCIQNQDGTPFVPFLSKLDVEFSFSSIHLKEYQLQLKNTLMNDISASLPSTEMLVLINFWILAIGFL